MHPFFPLYFVQLFERERCPKMPLLLERVKEKGGKKIEGTKESLFQVFLWAKHSHNIYIYIYIKLELIWMSLSYMKI